MSIIYDIIYIHKHSHDDRLSPLFNEVTYVEGDESL